MEFGIIEEYRERKWCLSWKNCGKKAGIDWYVGFYTLWFLESWNLSSLSWVLIFLVTIDSFFEDGDVKESLEDYLSDVCKADLENLENLF